MKLNGILAALAACSVMAATAVTPGEWNDDFADSLDYAETCGIPIAVVWGNTSCGYCNTLFNELEKSSELKAWLQKHRIVMVRKHEAYGSKDADNLAAKDWIKSRESQDLDGFPYVGVYWKDTRGVVKCSSSYTGRDGDMPVTTPKGDLAGQFVGSLDLLVGAYVREPLPTGEAGFVTADTEDDRLEVVSETETVHVPLCRPKADREIVNVLKATYPSSLVQSFRFTWPVGVMNMTVPVTINGSAFKAGKEIALDLVDANGDKLAESSIAMVKDIGNLPINPHWIGEYDAKALPYGEWTMDFDTAREKVRLYGGKLVAMFGGPLWCPNCEAIENDVFATRKFKDWARKNKLVLVHFDQGQASNPSTPEGTPRGRLLTLTPSTKGKSGASYLSRHGIDPYSDEVSATIDRVTFLTDTWLAPESTAARLANPVVLLLNGDGTGVDARFVRQNQGYEMDLNENMSRLEDLITLVGDDETKGYVSTTKLNLAPGRQESVVYHVNSRAVAYRLDDVVEGEYVKVTVTSSDRNAQPVTLSLVTSDGRTLATGTNRLVTDMPLKAEEISAGLFLKTASYESAGSAFFGKATSFAASVRFETSPDEPEQTVEFDSLSKAELKGLNPSLFGKLSATVPVCEAVALGGRRLVGTLSVSMSASNKLTVKFSGEKSVSFTGVWKEINLVTGAVSAELVKKDSVVRLAMDAAGSFAATLFDGPDEVGSGLAAIGDFSPFVGAYTVTLVDPDGLSGTAVLSVKLAKNGKASVSGTMPDGTSVSVSSMISLDLDGSACVPVYKRSTKGVFAACLSVAPFAAATWGNEGNTDTVRAARGCLTSWTAAGVETAFTVYGGYWKNGESPISVCGLFDLSEVLSVVVLNETVGVAMATQSGFKLAAKDVLTSLSFTKSTGIFSGKAKVVVDGKKVSASIKGVLLPGWIDCGCTGEPVIERPSGSGTLYYKVGKTVVSVPIDLMAVAR